MEIVKRKSWKLMSENFDLPDLQLNVSQVQNLKSETVIICLYTSMLTQQLKQNFRHYFKEYCCNLSIPDSYEKWDKKFLAELKESEHSSIKNYYNIQTTSREVEAL